MTKARMFCRRKNEMSKTQLLDAPKSLNDWMINQREKGPSRYRNESVNRIGKMFESRGHGIVVFRLRDKPWRERRAQW